MGTDEEIAAKERKGRKREKDYKNVCLALCVSCAFWGFLKNWFWEFWDREGVLAGSGRDAEIGELCIGRPHIRSSVFLRSFSRTTSMALRDWLVAPPYTTTLVVICGRSLATR